MSPTASRPQKVGRPRAQGPSDGRLAPREEVLAAAAELFTRDGYAATTTRAVAERAGLRQASMYHYFARKEDILATLLEGTVAPSLAFADQLRAEPEAAPGARLWALVRFDTALLLGGLSNLGALYQLPEVRGERFAEFRRTRAELAAAYREFLVPLAASWSAGELALRGGLVLGLVEGGVAVAREGEGRPPATVARAVADAALRLAGCTAEQLMAARSD